MASFTTLIDLNPAGPLATAIVLFSFVYGSFFAVDVAISTTARRDIADYLVKTDFAAATARLPANCQYLFERIFGRRHFTLRCLGKSLLFSCFSVLVLFFWAEFRAGMKFESLEAAYKAFTGTNFMIQIMAVAVLLWSLLADYFNLLKTRIIVNIFGDRTAVRVPILLLVVVADFIFGLAIFVLGVLCALTIGEVVSVIIYFEQCPKCAPHTAHLAYYMLLGSLQNYPGKYGADFPHLLKSLISAPLGDPYAILFLAGLLPSIWLWLYTLSSLMTKVIAASEPGIRFLRYFLDFENHPLTSIGTVAASVASALYLIVSVTLARVAT